MSFCVCSPTCLRSEVLARVTRDGVEIELTPTEFLLVRYLDHNRRRTLSKLQVRTQVWGHDAYDPNLVEVRISQMVTSYQDPSEPAAPAS